MRGGRLQIHPSILLWVVIVVGCHATPLPVHTSPDGSVVIREVPNTGGDPYLLTFEIIDQGKRPERFVTRASTVHRYGFLWDGNDAFTIDSSDIGLLRYERGGDGRWSEGEVVERVSPNGKSSARIFVASEGKRFIVSVSERFPDGSNGEREAVDLGELGEEVPAKYFVALRGGSYLTSRCVEWTGDESLAVHLKDRDIRLVKSPGDPKRWIVDKNAAK